MELTYDRSEEKGFVGKIFVLFQLIALFITASAVPAFAGAKDLKKDAGGYFFEKDNGEHASQ